MRAPLQPVDENGQNALKKPALDDGDAQMREWRRQWRRIMAHSNIYLDQVDAQSFANCRAHLALLGARFTPFFDGRDVTHLITKRSLDQDYPESDVLTRARNMGSMKIWTVEKLERFLTALLGHNPNEELNPAQTAKLGQLLDQEKLVGPSDRESDYHYFKGPYVMVWDPTNNVRTILHKEWAKPASNSQGKWPQLHLNPPGICPFLSGYSMKTNGAVKRKAEEEDKDKEPIKCRRMASTRTKQWGEIVASGMQRNSATSAVKSTAPATEQRTSREVMNLQRKVLPPPPTPKLRAAPKPKPLKRPGYCENCTERFDSFDEHVKTARHRKYAMNDRNFVALDSVISMLAREPAQPL